MAGWSSTLIRAAIGLPVFEPIPLPQMN